MNEPQAQVMNFVPDEMCLVVAADNIKEPARLYEAVRGWLNEQIARVLAADIAPTKRKPDAFDQDLEPVVLRRRQAEQAHTLLPLERAGVDLSASGLRPWRVLTRRTRGATTWHLYYQVGSRRASLDDAAGEVAERAELVRELVVLANQSLQRRQLVVDGQTITLVAATPNWLLAAAPFTCGCPGGTPALPPDDQRWSFKFGSAIEKAMDRPSGDVAVAVLDTCPSQRAVNAAAQRFPENDLLQRVQGTVSMNQPAVLPTAYYGSGYLAGCLPRWQENMTLAISRTPSFAMPDHGLFVTGIIRDIVPDATPVYLIRVLNDLGVGDLMSLTHVLAEVPRRLATTTGGRRRRVIVNLSLGSDLPIPERFLERWLPRTAANQKTLRLRLHEVCQTLGMLHANQSDLISWLTDQDVLIVAAAGNDALRRDVTRGDPPPPRFPARYDNVLGVASVRSRLDAAAAYSNRGDVAVFGNGVATFGGNVRPPASDTEPPKTDASVDPSTQRSNAVVGIFTQRQLPGSGVTNKTGWISWAGTSFATPVVSGIAAWVWGANPDLTAAEVRQKVRDLTQAPAPDASMLSVPVLEAFQTH